MSELVPDAAYQEMPIDHQLHIHQLHHRLNVIRAYYNQPMIVSSGYRTELQHRMIYDNINERRIKDGKLPIKPPMGSQHLIGAAVDISDPKDMFKTWITQNLELIEMLDLYMESFDATPGWVHLQLYPPLSKNRFFNP